MVRALGDIVTVLRDADPDDKAEIYRQLDLRLNYQPETQTVRAEVAHSPSVPHGFTGCEFRIRFRRTKDRLPDARPTVVSPDRPRQEEVMRADQVLDTSASEHRVLVELRDTGVEIAVTG